MKKNKKGAFYETLCIKRQTCHRTWSSVSLSSPDCVHGRPGTSLNRTRRGWASLGMNWYVIWL